MGGAFQPVGRGVDAAVAASVGLRGVRLEEREFGDALRSVPEVTRGPEGIGASDKAQRIIVPTGRGAFFSSSAPRSAASQDKRPAAALCLTGRCACGVSFSLFLKRDWDLHMRCFGLRWCGLCGEAAPFRRKCRPCATKADTARRRIRRHTDPAYRERWLQAKRADFQRRLLDPKFQARHNEQSRASMARTRARRKAA